MNSEIRTSITQLSNAVLDAVYATGRSFPIDPRKIIEACQGKIQVNDLPSGVDAEIRKTNESFAVTIRPNLHPNRERFTLAHELGHLFLHMNFLNPEKWNHSTAYLDGAFHRTEGDYKEEELQAHEFAANLLMPAEEFKRIARENCNAVKGVYYSSPIAEYFGVSVEAATVRGKWLGMFEW